MERGHSCSRNSRQGRISSPKKTPRSPKSVPCVGKAAERRLFATAAFQGWCKRKRVRKMGENICYHTANEDIKIGNGRCGQTSWWHFVPGIMTRTKILLMAECQGTISVFFHWAFLSLLSFTPVFILKFSSSFHKVAFQNTNIINPVPKPLIAVSWAVFHLFDHISCASSVRLQTCTQNQ